MRPPKRSEPREFRDGIITSLSTKGSGGDRVGVHVDGRHVFDLSASVMLAADLRKDQELSAERQRELLTLDEPYRAREAAFGMLARRDMSARELAGKLSTRGVEAETAAETVESLRESGYIDDRRFAGAFAAEKLKAGWGRQRIVSELVRKGVDRELLTGEQWTGLLESRGLSEDLDQVVELVRRRFAGQLESDPQGAKARINGFLARRGHDWGMIAAVMRELKAADDLGDMDGLSES